jgi:Ca-activated chloride channel family protein
VRAVIRDGLAETEVDQTFSNPGGRQVEGWYWFTLPARAIVTSFALETNGVLVEGEVIEKREAAARYQAAVQRAQDPALLEWIDGKSYRARIFPVPASGYAPRGRALPRAAADRGRHVALRVSDGIERSR